jgi:hypothetical protein
MNIKILMLIALLVNPTCFADGGSSVGHGGDAIAMEFASYAYAWVDLIARLPVVDRNGVDPDKLYHTIQAVTVRTEEHVYLDGEVDAYNQDNKIVVSRTRWAEDRQKQRLAISLHEFLGIMNIDRNYEVSVPFAEKYLSELNVLASVDRSPEYQCHVTLDSDKDGSSKDCGNLSLTMDSDEHHFLQDCGIFVMGGSAYASKGSAMTIILGFSKSTDQGLKNFSTTVLYPASAPSDFAVSLSHDVAFGHTQFANLECSKIIKTKTNK